MSEFTFRAYGVPQPQGSAKAFVRGGRAVVTSDNPKLHNWRDVIGWAARVEAARRRSAAAETRCECGRLPGHHGIGEHCAGQPALVLEGPVSLHATFYLPRPKSAPKRVVYPVTRPDGDKLLRGLCDALTGLVWRDDSQVVDYEVHKRYACESEAPGVHVCVVSR